MDTNKAEIGLKQNQYLQGNKVGALLARLLRQKQERGFVREIWDSQAVH